MDIIEFLATKKKTNKPTEDVIKTSLEIKQNETPVNEILDLNYASSDSDEEPNSKIWENEEFSLKKINTLSESLCDPVFDFRRTTNNGIKSRNNFKMFLIEEIKNII